MSSVDGHGLAVPQNAHVLPVDLGISKRRPAVGLGLLEELGLGAADRRPEELLAAHGVVVVDGLLGKLFRPRRAPGVARVLRVVAVEAADLVGRFGVAAEAQVALDRLRARAVGFRGHDVLRAHDDGRAVLGLAHGVLFLLLSRCKHD